MSAIESSGAPGIRMIAAAIIRDAEVRGVEGHAVSRRVVEASRHADAFARGVAVLAEIVKTATAPASISPSAKIAAAGLPDTVRIAAGNPAPAKPWMLAPLCGSSAAPATSAPIPKIAASTPPAIVSQRPCLMSAEVMPLSTEALCWKKIIHGVTVVDASNSNKMLKLPVGSGENDSAAPTAPKSGLVRIAEIRNKPLKSAIPNTIRSQRQ